MLFCPWREKNPSIKRREASRLILSPLLLLRLASLPPCTGPTAPLATATAAQRRTTGARTSTCSASRRSTSGSLAPISSRTTAGPCTMPTPSTAPKRSSAASWAMASFRATRIGSAGRRRKRIWRKATKSPRRFEELKLDEADEPDAADQGHEADDTDGWMMVNACECQCSEAKTPRLR